MSWHVEFHPAFEIEAEKYFKAVRIELAAYIRLLEDFGYELSRPYADTLKGSDYANMKELRFYADNGVWRMLMLLIRLGNLFYLLLEISQVLMSVCFIKNLLKRQIFVLMNI